MNKELLRELAKEAGFLSDRIDHWYIEESENLVELAVRECIKCGSVLANHYIETHSEQEQVLLLASIADYTNEIRKHFGMKE
jgi:hypothetical protein